MKFFLIFLIMLSSSVYARGKLTPEFEPYLSATRATFEIENAYSGSVTAAGAGIKIGASFGPIYFAGEVSGQIPVFYADEDDIEESVSDVSPLPDAELWMSYGVALGLRTKLFSFIYTYVFDSQINAQIRHEQSGLPDEKYDYTYKGVGHKVSAMFRLTKDLSIGAEYATYNFNDYVLDKDTHVVEAADTGNRDALSISAFSLLVNYKISVELM